ncbi:MAG: hypothetical protein QMD05_04010 [Candidatus Brocadiaceae bacterium]|nr:hypothetical protein [Candidatus Brocadiaceae bacterium]
MSLVFSCHPERSEGSILLDIMLKSKNSILAKGIRVHNLKNISLEIPLKKLVVVSGVSGSGKNSRVFAWTLFNVLANIAVTRETKND